MLHQAEDELREKGRGIVRIGLACETAAGHVHGIHLEVLGEEIDIKPPIVDIHLAAVDEYQRFAAAPGNHVGGDAGYINHVGRVEPGQAYFFGAAFLDIEVGQPAEDEQDSYGNYSYEKNCDHVSSAGLPAGAQGKIWRRGWDSNPW